MKTASGTGHRAPALPGLLLLALCFIWIPVHAAEQILDYAVELDVREDGSIDVVEHITVRAEGRQIRRGIYRDFPTRYRDRHGNNVVVGFDVIGVQRDGQPEPWFTETISNGVRINTGNDDWLPRRPGQYHYTLRYRTTRQLGFFAEHDELYWNAIGTGWVFPIAGGSVQVRLPVAVPSAQLVVDAYTGPQGAQGHGYRARIVEPGVARWELTQPLAPHEGLTIVLGFPKGLVAEPTGKQRLSWMLADNRGVLIAALGLVLLLAFCARRWHRVGRDPRPGIIIPRYEPPADRSPAELRYLMRTRYDTRCFTADLLSSAVDGQVTLQTEPRVLRTDHWQIQFHGRSAGADSGRFPTADELLGSLFGGQPATLPLDDKQAPRIQRATRAHRNALDQRLHGSHFKRNTGAVVVAFALTAITALVALSFSGGGGEVLISAICVAMVAISCFFASLVEAPTPEGRRLLDEIEGLKLYLSVAERDQLKTMQAPSDAPPALDAQRYERLLPYAVALDVEEAWTKKFTAAVGVAAAGAATAGMAWYRGGRPGDLGSFATSIGKGLNASAASASTPPGSSSGGGGGGFSGGGGGGGGGGGR